MFDEFRIGVVEKKIVVNQRLPRDDTEQMNQSLRRVADMATNNIAASGRIEDGEIDVGIGVSRVEEAAQTNRLWRFPDLENSVDIDKMIEEGAVLVPALAGADGAEDGDERRKVRVNLFELAAEEGTNRVQKSLKVKVLRQRLIGGRRRHGGEKEECRPENESEMAAGKMKMKIKDEGKKRSDIEYDLFE